ncbi:MAG: proline dehydrogenase family protein [Chloroflexi bacterium]|nr:proline dehydrogenase family protein [Chloroflexota bacterium]
MLRSLLLNLSKSSWAKRQIASFWVAKRVAGRFVAGELPEDAIRAITDLNARGIVATVDHLGESVTDSDEAVRAAEAYLDILDRIAEAKVRSNASLKLSQLGLNLSLDLCAANLRKVLERARSLGLFIRIDMEDSPSVDRTLEIYQRMRSAAFDNTGVVIQAYLYRSEQDVARLLKSNTRFRLCKGAYQEPASVAYPAKRDVDASFFKLGTMMLDAAAAAKLPADPRGITPPIPGLATHDEKLVRALLAYAEARHIPKSFYEFQMLHGIRRDLQEELAAQGYGVRVYVPYGREWYPYFMRRLAERPANLWFFVSNFLRA